MTATIAVALDVPDLATVGEISRAVAPHVSTLKIGLEVFLRDGRSAVDAAMRAAADAGSPCDLFLDLKLHDIPNTVAGAARAVADVQPAFLTVHASGGAAMIDAAAQALPETKIVAVTVLTSLSQADIAELGWTGTARDVAVRLAVNSVAAGARAIVCSPQEVAAIRAAVPSDVVLITPGVRPAGADVGDQSRIATPVQAAQDGANILVIGRPITASSDPAMAAATIADEVASWRDERRVE